MADKISENVAGIRRLLEEVEQAVRLLRADLANLRIEKEISDSFDELIGVPVRAAPVLDPRSVLDDPLPPPSPHATTTKSKIQMAPDE